MAATQKQSPEAVFYGALLIFGVLSSVVVAIFSFAHYWALRRKYLRGPTERVFDPRGSFRRLLSISLLAGFASILTAVVCTASPTAAWLAIPLLLGILYWAGMCQALIYLGFVVDLGRRKLIFPPNLQNSQLADFFLVYPILVRLATPDEIDLDFVEDLTREHGKFVLVHGRFGSRRVGFSDKLKRDECVHLIRRHAAGNIRRLIDFD